MSPVSQKRRVLVWLVAGAAAVVLATSALSGCVGGLATPTPTPTRTPQFAATAIPTDSPTLTPIGGALVATEVQAVPTAPPTPLPENVNPLTGEAVADASVLDRVPVAIKIDNYPPDRVWPQNGLNGADLIFEHYNEGWFSSRFTAVYLGQSPTKVGSVRSGRIIDLEIPAMYKAAFACSGFSNGVLELVKNSDLYPNQIASESLPATLHPTPFYRDETREAPFNMYTNPERVRAWAAAHGLSGRQDLQGMAFSTEPPADGTPAAYVQVPWNKLNAEWKYDGASGRYFRWSNGQPHMDALDGQQLNVANVVMLYVPQYDTDIVEDPHWGSKSIRWELWYSNRAVIFRDGVRIEAFWQRWERPDLLTFTDEAGTPIPLKVGNTFFELLPTDGEHWIEIVVQ